MPETRPPPGASEGGRARAGDLGCWRVKTRQAGGSHKRILCQALVSSPFCSCRFLSCGSFLPFISSLFLFDFPSSFSLCPPDCPFVPFLPVSPPLLSLLFPSWYTSLSVCVPPPSVSSVSPFLGLWPSAPLPSGVSLSHAHAHCPGLASCQFPRDPGPHLRPSSLPGPSVSNLENWRHPHPTHSPRVEAAGVPGSRVPAGGGAEEVRPGGRRWGCASGKRPPGPAPPRPAPVSIKPRSAAPPQLGSSAPTSPGLPGDLPPASPWISAPSAR